MSRYIDADLVIELLEKQKFTQATLMEIGQVQKIIQNIQTADVVEVAVIQKILQELNDRAFNVDTNCADDFEPTTDNYYVIGMMDAVKIIKKHVGCDICDLKHQCQKETADVRENVKGEWKDRGKYALGYMCSHCQKASINKSDFCPNCGADMRGEV